MRKLKFLLFIFFFTIASIGCGENTKTVVDDENAYADKEQDDSSFVYDEAENPDDLSDTDIIETGELGGECYGNNTCNDGLECKDGICVEAEVVSDSDTDAIETDNEISDDVTDEINDADEFIPESCDDLKCQKNSTCYESVTGPQCVCDDGYGEVEEGVCEEVEEGWDRFEVIKHLDGNMVFDKETNLTWPQGLDDLQVSYIKIISIIPRNNICFEMNEYQYGGHDDWRPATYQNFVDIISEEVLDYQEHKCKYTGYEESYNEITYFPYYDEYCYMTDEYWTELERNSIFYKQFEYQNNTNNLFLYAAFEMEWIDRFNNTDTLVKGGAALSASRGLALYAYNIQLSNYDTEPPTNYEWHMAAHYTGAEKVRVAHICVR